MASNASYSSLLGSFAVICLSLAASGCHHEDKVPATEVVTPEPMADLTSPQPSDQIIDDSAPELSLGSNVSCGITVLAKSAAAVADPCMTTQQFVASLTDLSLNEKNRALGLILASDRLFGVRDTRLAH